MTFEQGWNELYDKILDQTKLMKELAEKASDEFWKEKFNNKRLGLIMARQLMDGLDGQLYNE